MLPYAISSNNTAKKKVAQDDDFIEEGDEEEDDNIDSDKMIKVLLKITQLFNIQIV